MSSCPSVSELGPHFECTIRLPTPDSVSANILFTILKYEQSLSGITKQVDLCQNDTTSSTVVIVLQGATMRSLRVAVNSTLEQAKLVLRTMRLYPPNTQQCEA
ncbi:unnamed protein product [Phytomonas sp. EM1]|nr:unnamed protein product [Phytomonas sp. EM1]|eukprot:CCW60542.1 unnamed protein product [Phytomonas sp. isolate EM1]